MIERYGILNDIHFPYEDKYRYKIALKIFKEVGIDRLYLNGDIAEFLNWSTHPQHPLDVMRPHAEIDYINKKFDELQELFPDIPVDLIEGNHCYRFFRYIRDMAPAMWGLIDCPSLLKFPDRPKWKFVPYGPSQLVQCGKSKLWLRHEPLAGGQCHAKGTAENSCIDLGYGHTHTHQVYSHRKFGPVPFTNKAYSLGWLGDRSRHVFDYRGAKDKWVTGCTNIECDIDSGNYTLDFIDLDKIPVFYKGRLFDAK